LYHLQLVLALVLVLAFQELMASQVVSWFPSNLLAVQ
jgi:hypothetical protein